MTPAVIALQKAGIDHRIQAYDHDPSSESYGREAAEALGLDADSVFKTLLAVVDRTETVVAIVPVSNQLDLKALARVAGGKRATMADPADAERLTGYVVGGISPLGQRKRLRTFIDSSAEDLGHINVSGGRRGLEIGLAPTDLAGVLSARFAPLVATTAGP